MFAYFCSQLGMQETTVLGVFHPEAGQLYDVTTSLEKVCQQLHDPKTKLDTIQIQVFCPFRPMLANRAPPVKVPEIMGNQPFFVETKYDGERVQLHKDGAKYKYYSRKYVYTFTLWRKWCTVYMFGFALILTSFEPLCPLSSVIYRMLPSTCRNIRTFVEYFISGCFGPKGRIFVPPPNLLGKLFTFDVVLRMNAVSSIPKS